MRLIESSGFDSMLRLDAKLDGTLNAGISELMPPELRVEIAGAVDHTLGYAEMRRAMSEAVASRLDSAVIDRNLRWWASSTGQAVSAAQIAAFRELTDPQPVSATGVPTPAAKSVDQTSPFSLRLPDLAGASRGTRECLRMMVGFRRECANSQATSQPAAVPDAANTMLSPYARLSAADLAAFKVYLDSPGAREVVSALVDSYLQTRSSSFGRVQHLIDDAVGRFARAKIGNESDATLRSVISLVDDGRSLEEARLILHLLRSLTPRDPRVLVELARVAIKQGPLIRDRVPPGEPAAVDPEFLDDAQSWMDHAIALEPKRADTLVLAGHLAYLKHQYPESIALLEKARRIGTNNPWLPLNLSDALWALGQDKDMDRGYLGRAAQELETAIAKGLPVRMRLQALDSLSHLYADMGDFDKARGQFQRRISSSTGYDKASAWREYAWFLLYSAGDLEGSIAAAREATRFGDFETGNSVLAQALLVKAGSLYLNGQPTAAAKLVQEAQIAMPGLEDGYSGFARLRRTLPAVFALHEAGVIGELSSTEGGQTLLLACAHASAADIERLINWGADPNYLDPDEGAPLHVAIRARNLPAIRALLAHGADVSMREQNGLMPLEFAEMYVERSERDSADIVALLRAASARDTAAAPVGTPLRSGYIYEALKPISGDRWGHDVKVGMRITFISNCKYTDDSLACLNFKQPGNEDFMMDVALLKDQLVSWQEWFREIGPAPVK